MNWTGKTVIITGSSMGIGRATAEQLAQKQANIVLNARNAARLETVLKDFKAEGYANVIAIAGDVSKPADCQQLVEGTIKAFGGLDVLINNAGLSAEGNVGELDPTVFQKLMEVNYLGAIYMAQQALPYLRQSLGSVLFVSSVAAIRGIPRYAAYSASKMALTALAESLKIEEAKPGVHVAIAYVGFTENAAQKKIYNKDGNLVAQPARDFIKQEPVEKVAARLVKMLEQRRFKSVFTPLGKLNAIANRFFPGLVAYLLRRNYE